MGRPIPYIGTPSEVNFFYRPCKPGSGLAALQTADSLYNRKVYILIVTVVDDIII